jgi:hypothetical protein
MRAWVLTIIDVAFVCAAYWFFCWLSGDEPTLGGFAFAVAIIALLSVTRLKLGAKQ